tara:strand:- start:1147 stop:1572 length:426 start_codon:yes stop_codon:yes gene_type:complete
MKQNNTGGVKFTGDYFDEAIDYVQEKEKTPIEFTETPIEFTRKQTPVYSGVLNYFPDAIREVAQCSFMGNYQHNPDKHLHWDRSKSGDELDALTRHLLEAGAIDTDGVRHSAKVAWRALANLQKEIERSNEECTSPSEQSE